LGAVSGLHHAHIDKFAYQDSVIHRLDSRVKFVVLAVFTAVVISQPRESVVLLSVYAVGPFAVLVLGQIPLRFVFKQILLVSPFILVLALTCPFYDSTAVQVAMGPFSWTTTGGWLRCGSILGKFVVTMMCMIALVSTTKFSSLLAGLQKLGVPRMLVLQLGFLYRYIFLVIDRAQHMLLSRRARSWAYLGFRSELKTGAAMIGSLFVRSIDSAEKISTAMQARGFSQDWRNISRLHISRADYVFSAIAVVYLLGLEIFIRPLFT
jgi:cobalt/nickel transport system permease protein